MALFLTAGQDVSYCNTNKIEVLEFAIYQGVMQPTRIVSPRVRSLQCESIVSNSVELYFMPHCGTVKCVDSKFNVGSGMD